MAITDKVLPFPDRPRVRMVSSSDLRDVRGEYRKVSNEIFGTAQERLEAAAMEMAHTMTSHEIGQFLAKLGFAMSKKAIRK